MSRWNVGIEIVEDSFTKRNINISVFKADMSLRKCFRNTVGPNFIDFNFNFKNFS